MTTSPPSPPAKTGQELETEDPIAALDNKSIAVRAAACRDLTKMGTIEHLARLAQSAGSDKSPAVRLGTVAAASDILSRRRLDAPEEALSDAQRKEVVDLFKRIDPSVNPGVFSVFATLDVPAGLSRVSIGLRDPRQEVRKGAGVGLMRLCISRARHTDAELEAKVVALLTDRRMRPDAIAEVARVCAAAGYATSLDVLERLDPGGVHQEVVDQVIDQLQLAAERPVGTWVSDGRDAGEVRVVPAQPGAILLVTPTEAWLKVAGQGWSGVSLDDAAWRRMFYRRAGTQEAAPALQGFGHTFHTTAPDALPELVDTFFSAETARWPGGVSQSPAGRVLAESLGDTPVERRARALLLADAGDFAGAAAELDEALAQRKAPADVRYLLGLARVAVGDVTGAAAAWEACIAKARRKKDWYVAAAKARLADA